jgi:hypothetical protein
VSILSVGLPAALIAAIPDVGRSEAWGVTIWIIVYGGIRLSVLWTRGIAELFDFFFWLYSYIFMGIAATAQLRSNQISTTTPGMDPALDMPTALLVAGGIGCYELGRMMANLRPQRALGDAPSKTQVSTRRTVLLGVAGLAFGAYYLSKVRLGGAIGSRTAAEAARAAAWPDPSTRSIFFALACYPLLVAVGGLIQARRAEPGGANRGVLAVAAVVGAVVLVGVVNPIVSARYTFGTMAFALAVYLGATRTRFRARLTMLGTILAFLFVFPIADAFRRDVVRVQQGGFFDEYLGNADYDSFWQVANAFSLTVDNLVVPLRQLLGSLLFWMPRSLWPDKPIDTGSLLAQYRGYSFDNLSAPLWAELLVNGGVVAVVIGCLALGVALVALDRRIRDVGGTSGWWLIPQAVLPVYMTIFMRGSWLQATGPAVVALTCMLFVLARRAPGGGGGAQEGGSGTAVEHPEKPEAGREVADFVGNRTTPTGRSRPVDS